MKKGIILYVAGQEPDDFPECSSRIIEKLRLDAERVELVSAGAGRHDIHEAAWCLTVKGMQYIECMMAEVASSGNLEPTGRTLRICG